MTPAQQQDLARRAMRGERALKDAGYANPAIAPAASGALGSVEPTHQVINAPAAGTYVLIPGISTHRIKVYEVFLYTDTAVTVEFFADSETLTGPLQNFPSQSGLFFGDMGRPHWILDAGQSLKLVTGGAAQVSGYLRYLMEF